MNRYEREHAERTLREKHAALVAMAKHLNYVGLESAAAIVNFAAEQIEVEADEVGRDPRDTMPAPDVSRSTV